MSDLDGTLLGADGMLSAESAGLLNEAIEAGVLFTYATARSFSSASRATEGLQLVMPVITYGGTMIVSSRTGSPDQVRLLDETPVNLMAAEFERIPAVEPVWFTFEDGRDWVRWRPDRTTAGLELFLARRVGDRRLRPITSDDPLDPRGVFYVTVIAERAILGALRTTSSGALGSAAHFLSDDPSTPGLAWFEVHDGAGTKAHAIRRLAADYGADRLVVFGDNHNDIPMFTVADQGFAVANAVPELTAVATAVIGHHDTDAVARHIVVDALEDGGATGREPRIAPPTGAGSSPSARTQTSHRMAEVEEPGPGVPSSRGRLAVTRALAGRTASGRLMASTRASPRVRPPTVAERVMSGSSGRGREARCRRRG